MIHNEDFGCPQLTFTNSYNLIHAGWMTFSKYIQETKYQNPIVADEMPFNKQFGGEKYFDWLAKQPALLKPFHKFMMTQREGHPQWLDFYPLEQELVSGFDAKDHNAVLLVDVGGSVGHEIQAVKKKYLQVPGRMILQDRQASIARAVPVTGMETMAHDFFTPQPIKGQFSSPIYIDIYLICHLLTSGRGTGILLPQCAP